MSFKMRKAFPRSFRPILGITANVLIFILLVEFPISIGGFSYYDGDDINDFLKLCSACKSCSSSGCPLECMDLLRSDRTIDYDDISNPCSNEYLLELKTSQETVKKFKGKLDSYIQAIVLWALFVPSVCIGVYLIAVGHFDWRTLPIIGSKYHPDPTTGIPYWQYYRMKYVVAKSEVSKDKGNDEMEEKPSAGSFIYDDVSTIGTDSSESEALGFETSHEYPLLYEPSRADLHSFK